MSICSNGTKKPRKKEKDQPKQMPTEGVEALVDGDVEKAEEVGVDPMAIPDYFNNIRNNYFVANRIIWLTDDIEWPIVTDVLKRLAFADDKTGDPIWLFIGSCGGLCDARGLRTIIENSIMDIMYETPSEEDIESVEVTKDVITKHAKPRVVRKNSDDVESSQVSVNDN